MPNLLQSLKVVAAVRPQHVSPVVTRRNRLVARIDQQIQVAQAFSRGEQFIANVTRRKRDAATGEVMESVRQRRVKECWWVTDDGKLMLYLRYGLRTIEFAKGKSAIEVGTMEKLIPTLELLKSATLAGELDDLLWVASVKTPKNKPKKPTTN
jgi:hypothetical protein